MQPCPSHLHTLLQLLKSCLVLILFLQHFRLFAGPFNIRIGGSRALLEDVEVVPDPIAEGVDVQLQPVTELAQQIVQGSRRRHVFFFLVWYRIVLLLLVPYLED